MFVQSKGTKDLDASVLLMPLVRFISPVDPMWRSTMRAIEGRLVEDTLVHRYEAERTQVDGMPGGEDSFTACSFWYIECLARAGELEKAQLLFEKMLGYANHLGLYSEQLGSNARHLSAGVHPSRTDQRRDVFGQGALRDSRFGVALESSGAR